MQRRVQPTSSLLAGFPDDPKKRARPDASTQLSKRLFSRRLPVCVPVSMYVGVLYGTAARVFFISPYLRVNPTTSSFFLPAQETSEGRVVSWSSSASSYKLLSRNAKWTE